MDSANLPPNSEAQPDLLTELNNRLAAVEAIPANTESQYQEPVDDKAEAGDWQYPVTNEATLGKLENGNNVRPEAGTAALAVGPTQDYELLSMYPELAALHVVDISPAAVGTARAIPELLLRIKQLTGRVPAAAEIIAVLEDSGSHEYDDNYELQSYTPPLAERILALPLAAAGQLHAFGPDELHTIANNQDEIAGDLQRQLDSDSSWLQPDNLARIANMYEHGQIQVHC